MFPFIYFLFELGKKDRSAECRLEFGFICSVAYYTIDSLPSLFLDLLDFLVGL